MSLMILAHEVAPAANLIPQPGDRGGSTIEELRGCRELHQSVGAPSWVRLVTPPRDANHEHRR
jgi:hypothetical protein